MEEKTKVITRRDFIRGASCAALGTVVGLPLACGQDSLGEKDSILDKKKIEKAPPSVVTRAVLVRHSDAVDKAGAVNEAVIRQMMDDAVTALFDVETAADAWKLIIRPDDVVGIKSNVAGPPSTPEELELALADRILEVGVSEKNLDIGDRGVLRQKVFLNSTALINVRPLRTHHWSGIGSLIKNYIMFDPRPANYHDNYCADLATLWNLPIVKGKTRLNILVLLTPLFHGIGPHHYDPKYTWKYNGLLVGTDPVALDSIGLHLLQRKRREYFGEKTPIRPTPHHVVFADTKHKLGTSDLRKIELMKLGWKDGILI
jgi:hypothetical protein